MHFFQQGNVTHSAVFLCLIVLYIFMDPGKSSCCVAIDNNKLKR